MYCFQVSDFIFNFSAKVVFKALLSSDWQTKKNFQVQQILDANVPNYELEHVHTVKRVASIFANQKKLEKEGNNFAFTCRTRICHVESRLCML